MGSMARALSWNFRPTGALCITFGFGLYRRSRLLPRRPGRWRPRDLVVVPSGHTYLSFSGSQSRFLFPSTVQDSMQIQKDMPIQQRFGANFERQVVSRPRGSSQASLAFAKACKGDSSRFPPARPFIGVKFEGTNNMREWIIKCCTDGMYAKSLPTPCPRPAATPNDSLIGELSKSTTLVSSKRKKRTDPFKTSSPQQTLPPPSSHTPPQNPPTPPPPRRGTTSGGVIGGDLPVPDIQSPAGGHQAASPAGLGTDNPSLAGPRGRGTRRRPRWP